MQGMLGFEPGGRGEVVRRAALENQGSVWAVLSFCPRWVTSLGVTVLSVFYAPSNSRIQRRLPPAAHPTPLLLSPPPGTCRRAPPDRAPGHLPQVCSRFMFQLLAGPSFQLLRSKPLTSSWFPLSRHPTSSLSGKPVLSIDLE